MSTTETNPVQKTFLQRWSDWRAVVLLVVLTLGLAPVMYRGYRLGQVPVIDPPFDVEKFTEPIPDDENAYHGFEQAYGELVDVPHADYDAYNDQLESGWDFDTDILERHLDNNRRALKTWRETCELDQYQPYSYQTQDYSPLIPVSDTRELNRLAKIQIQKYSKLGTPEKALPWIRASLKHAHLIRQRGQFVNYRVGVAFFSSSSHVIADWSAHTNLTRSELDKAMQALIAARRLNPLISENTKGSYLADSTFYGNQSIEEVIKAYRSSGMQQPLGAKWEWWLEGEPEYTHRLFPHLTRNHLLYIDKPRRERPPLIGDHLFDDSYVSPVNQENLSTNELLELMDQSYLFDGMSFGYLPGILNDTDRDEVRYRCLLVALAAQAYLRDHGEFPADAVGLVPEYLDEIPDDVYSPTPAPLIYRRDGEGAVVYSRFENEIDDGGGVVDYQEMARGGDLPDLGIRIRSPFSQPLHAPKPAE